MADEFVHTVPPEHGYQPTWSEKPEAWEKDYTAREDRIQRLQIDVSLEWGRSTAKELQALLFAYRRSVKLPGVRIAEAMGVSDSVIARLERNHRDARLSTILRYARCVGLDLELVEKDEAIA